MTRKISENEARQGRLGRPVLIVLSVSRLLAAIYLLGMGFWAQSSDDLSSERSSIDRQIGEIEG